MQRLPDGWRVAMLGEKASGKATHAICSCPRRELVEADADSHTCKWTFLVRVGPRALAREVDGG